MLFDPNPSRPLRHYAWFSIVAALVTIALKTAAWLLTDSVGLLSDALESLVNLAAALAMLAMLAVAAKPPDEQHAFGYSKAEYFASSLEGALIFLAATAIAWTAIERLITPRPLERVGAGLAVSAVAAAINFAVARILLTTGRVRNSIALEADAHHLMTDVWTSVGVIVAVAAVGATGWLWLDPVIALAVAANILWSGFRLMQRSFYGLMDRALPADDQATIREVLARFEAVGIEFHALRTRQAAGRSFITVHVLVPGDWTVRRGHSALERIEDEIRAALPGAVVFTHLEPRGDSASYRDIELDH